MNEHGDVTKSQASVEQNNLPLSDKTNEHKIENSAVNMTCLISKDWCN